MLRNKPLIEQGPQAALFLPWQIEEARGDRPPATCSSASALPLCATITVEEVVVRDLLIASNRSKRDNMSRVSARDNVTEHSDDILGETTADLTGSQIGRAGSARLKMFLA
jgi:hypothetical protein